MSDRCAVITGASRGLGFGVASTFVANGWKVVLISRDPARLDASVTELEKLHPGTEIKSIAGDVTDPVLPQKVMEQTGKIDALVLNHGGPPAGSLLVLTEDQWEYSYELIIGSTLRWLRVFVPHFKKNQFGRISIIASTSMREPIVGLAASNVLRAGLTGLVKTASKEWGSEGITINAIAPGSYDTDRLRHLFAVRAESNGTSFEMEKELALKKIPVARFGNPEELGRVVEFLSRNENGYITGQTIVIDGGMVTGLP